MARRIELLTMLAAAVCQAVLFACAAPADAQEAESAAPPPVPVVAPIAVPEIAAQAEAATRSMREVAGAIAPDPNVSRIDEALPALAAELEKKAGETAGIVEAGASRDALTDLENAWVTRSQKLAGWRATLTKRAMALEQLLGQLEELQTRWKSALEQAEGAEAPQAVLERARGVLDDIKRHRRQVRERRSVILTLQSRVSQSELIASDVLEQLRSARSQFRARLFNRDHPPLWGALFPPLPTQPLGLRLRESLASDAESLEAYASAHLGALYAQGILLLGVLAFALAARRRAARWDPNDPRLEFAELISRYPVSTSFLVAMLATPWLHPAGPIAFDELAGLALIVPALRLLPALLESKRSGVLWAVACLYLIDRLRGLVEVAVPVTERLVFVAELAAAAALLAWLLRPARMRRLPEALSLPRVLGLAVRVSLVVLLAALVSDFFGYGALSRLLGQGVLNSTYVAIILYAGARVAAMLIAVLLYGRPLRWMRFLKLQEERVRRGSARLLGWAAFGLWLYVTLEIFAVRDPLFAWLTAALALPFTAGTVAISLGDLLAFAVTLAAALLLSGLVRVVLRDDVFPRLALGRGIPHAISATFHYALLFFGFFLALAAAGVDFSRFTILAGALGVGIGFGLQNVVNNFVSGLILLYERPVQVGDTLEVGELIGEIKRIGIRSSTIRTWQGAEVIMPNSNLISESVINWTLSDRQRRIDIPVGVSYGSDPPQVAALLLDVVRSHPMILSVPAPQVLFKAFGESSLDFEVRGWTERFETHVQMRSEITFAIHAALRAAGIEIPFPQRDLHLRSVAESVKQAPAEARGAGERRDPE